jgi:hypothetical protein
VRRRRGAPVARAVTKATAPPRARACLAVACAALAFAACDAGKTKIIGADHPAAQCAVGPGPPPAGLGADPFYGKYLDGNGIPVLASPRVSDEALVSACVIVVRMASLRDDVRQAMIGQGMRAGIVGRDEVTTDLPEYRDLDTRFPGVDWDALRGVGATLGIPVSSAGEENLLCLAGDKYRGRSVMVQSFATAVLLGLEAVDATFAPRLQAAYDAALAAGLWAGTFARANPIEYYVEGVEDWFEADVEASPPDGTRNEVNTRADLLAYDPTLAALVAESMPDDGWRPGCH